MIALAGLSGCGLAVPDLKEPWGAEGDSRQMVKEIAKSVYLEVENAVGCLVEADADESTVRRHHHQRKIAWFDNWGVQLSLNLTVDEASSLNPGVTFNTPMIPATTRFPNNITVPASQLYTLGLGGKFSSRAQRIDKISAYFDVQTLIDNYKARDKEYHRCAYNDQVVTEADRSTITFAHDSPSPTAKFESLLITSDLKLEEWLSAALFLETVSGAKDVLEANFKQNVISHEVKFEVVSDGNITPSWKLVRVSANTGAPFFGASRSRVHDLIITFGPKAKQPSPAPHKAQIVSDSTGKPIKTTVASKAAAERPAGLSEDARNSHLASEIGLAVANSLRGLTQP
ncbi:MAG: hypothetical protein C3F11_07510 [Methylocystaceae bacterium]|nr:MAG: hypothetical protein C3F11_07510 [Methylocystaceae bacterium]